MRKSMAAAIVAISVGIGIAVGIAGDDTVIEEDMPGWDCHTMGNRICGED